MRSARSALGVQRAVFKWTAVGKQKPPLRTVELSGAGRVSLAEIELLYERRAETESTRQELSRRLEAITVERNALLEKAGAILVAHQDEWAAPADIAANIKRADQLAVQMADAERERERVLKQANRSANSIVRIVKRVGAWWHRRRMQKVVTVINQDMAAVRIHIAQTASTSGLGPATTSGILERTKGLAGEAQQVRAHDDALEHALAALASEISMREESLRRMGFDAIYEAALLQSGGPRRRTDQDTHGLGEMELISGRARLSQLPSRSYYELPKADIELPVKITGIQFRRTRYCRQPVPQENVRDLGSGTLSVSTRHLAFDGSGTSPAVSLSDIRRIHIYSNALTVLYQNRKTPDIFFVRNPFEFAFYLEWASRRLRRS